MKKKLPIKRSRIVFSLLGAFLLIGIVWAAMEQDTMAGPEGETGRLEKLIVANGNVAMNVDLDRLNGTRANGTTSTLRFTAVPDTFFKVVAFDGEFRAALPSAMELVPQEAPSLPAPLMASYQNLVVETLPFGGDYDMVVRDGKTGFLFFNIEGYLFNYNQADKSLTSEGGRLLVSSEFAAALGRPSATGTVVGDISIDATMRTVEITKVENGEIQGDVLPATSPEAGGVPGPDVIVGDLTGLAQFGSAGTQVGLAVGTDSCNAGTIDLHWFANPINDHPVIPQNLYRMSGGPANDERFEQIGQSQMKHAFTALTGNICGFGCNGVGGSNLGSGCSDPYGASLNSGPNLGSRAWANPFTGAYPRNDSSTPNNSHGGHSHNGVSHRILVEKADLDTSQNQNASYYAEAQYVTPHEWAWCQANPGQCNMYNNVSYRKYNVSGTTSFSFSSAGSTQRTKRAVSAWPGATFVEIEPAPGQDGRAVLAYKITNPSQGLWHYEYAIFNENLDRAIQSFSLPIGAMISLSNFGWHAPPQHPGWSADGTADNAGFSNLPWNRSFAADYMTWSSESFAQNPNANAIRWGTMYNIRFDSDRGPEPTNAIIGFLKTGAPMSVPVLAPGSPCRRTTSQSRYQCGVPTR